jgi:Mn2+/Fe2+ NRAMP family transporter
LIPTFTFSKDYLLNIVAIFGTTISPYLFFWQASEEVEEEVEKAKLQRMGAGHPRVTIFDLKKLRADTIAGMIFSNLIMFFIIITTGATLHQKGIFSISTASEAASALSPIAGEFASLLFALGIIGTGLLAVPILAGSASYAVAETFGWREGLSLKLAKAKGFYGVIIFAVLIGAILNFTGINPISALYYSAVINGIIAPVLIFIILLISNNKEIMGEKVNGLTSNILGFTTAVLMTIFAVALIVTSFFPS